MVTDKTLSAALTGEETLTGDLDAIAASAFGTAEGFDAIQDNSTGAAAGIDVLEGRVDALGGELDDTLGDAAGLSVGLEGLDETVSGTGTEFLDSTADVSVYGDALGGATEDAFEASVANEAVAGSIDSVGDEATESAAEVVTYGGALDALPAAAMTQFGVRGGEVPDLNTPESVSTGVDVAAPESIGVPTPADHTVGIDAAVDQPSFATAEGLGLSEQAIVDYQARVGEQSFAAAGAAADGLPDEESVLFEALSDAASFSEAESAATGLPDGEQVAYEAALDTASFAGVEETVSGMLSEEDVAIEPNADLGAFGRTKAWITDLFGDGEEVDVSADVETVGFEAAAAAAETLPDDETVSYHAAVDKSSFAAADAAAAGVGAGGGGAGGGSGLSGGFLGVRGSLGSVGALAAGALGPVTALGAGLGGLAGGGLAAGGALGAIGFGGLKEQASGLVGQTVNVDGELKQLNNTSEATDYLFGQIGQKANSLFAPLENAQTSEFFSGIVSGGLTVLDDFVTLTTQVEGPVLDAFGNLGDAFDIQEPRIFAAVEEGVVTTLPYLEDFGEYILNNAAPAISFMTDTADELLPKLGEFATQVMGILPPVATLGTDVLSVALPALSGLLGVVTPLISAAADLPDPVRTAGVVAAGAAAGAWVLGDALAYDEAAMALAGDEAALLATGLEADEAAAAVAGAEFSVMGTASAVLAGEMGLAEAAALGLDAALGVLASPIVIIGALAGGAYLLADHFGYLDDVAGAVGGTLDWLGGVAAGAWNVVVEGAERGINATLGIADALGLVNAFGGAMDWLGGVADWLGDKFSDVLSWLGGAWQSVGKFVGKVIDKMGGWFQGFVNTGVKAINALLKAYNAIPGHSDVKLLQKVDFSNVAGGGSTGGVDFSGFEIHGGGSSDSGDESGDGSGDGSPPPASGGRGPYPDGAAAYAGGTNYNYGDINIDARGSDMSKSQIESVVKQAIDEEDSGRDRHQRKRSNPTG